MTAASAPGKIILFGEHAVVYGRPALAVPIGQVHADVEITGSGRPGIWLNAPDIGLDAELNALASDHALAAVIHNLFFSLGISPFPALEIKITSTIPVASGLGSGAAVSVALTRALAAHLGKQMSNEQVNVLAYEIEKLHHGTPSGIDNTVITYNRPIYFTRAAPIETFVPGAPFTLAIGDTGRPAPTKQSVAAVRRLWESDKPAWERVFDRIGEIVRAAREDIERGKRKELGELMNENHALLRELTVSSPELDNLVHAARQAGALGAKLSGGGRGGNMLALVEESTVRDVAAALSSAGAKRVIINTVGAD